MTEAMKDIMVKIMVEVLEIFAIMTTEIRQGRASESNLDKLFSELKEVQRRISRNFSRN
jgi:ribosome recycling factor